MALVFFERQGKTVRANAGMNLRKLALANGIEIYQGVDKLINCRGQGLCGTCKVEVTAPNLYDVNPRTAMEGEKLKNFTNPKLRLSCQVVVHGNISVKTAPVELMKHDEEVVAPPLVTSV
jgi:ferredoxin